MTFCKQTQQEGEARGSRLFSRLFPLLRRIYPSASRTATYLSQRKATRKAENQRKRHFWIVPFLRPVLDFGLLRVVALVSVPLAFFTSTMNRVRSKAVDGADSHPHELGSERLWRLDEQLCGAADEPVDWAPARNDRRNARDDRFGWTEV